MLEEVVSLEKVVAVVVGIAHAVAGVTGVAVEDGGVHF